MNNLKLTVMRCTKVENALESDKNMRALLGPKEHTVHKPPPSNAPVKFSDVVIAITSALIAEGHDPMTYGQPQIKAFSIPILVDVKEGKPLPKFDVAVEAPAPAATEPEAAKPKPKAKAKTKPAPKRTAKRAPPKAALNNNGPLVTPEAPKADPEKPNQHVAEQFVLGQKPSKASSRLTAPESAQLPAPVLDDARTAPAGNLLPYVWGVSANTLILSAIQLVERNGLADTPLCKRLIECSNDVVKLTVIPRNAKESPSSPDRSAAP